MNSTHMNNTKHKRIAGKSMPTNTPLNPSLKHIQPLALKINLPNRTKLLRWKLVLNIILMK